MTGLVDLSLGFERLVEQVPAFGKDRIAKAVRNAVASAVEETACQACIADF